MINQEVSQRNGPYIIALGLIILAFLTGWLANELLQTANLQVNIGGKPAAALSTELHPADRKLGNYIYGAVGSVSAQSNELHPADRKLSNYIYEASGSVSATVAELHPADRKLSNYIYTTIGSESGGIGASPGTDTADQ